MDFCFGMRCRLLKVVSSNGANRYYEHRHLVVEIGIFIKNLTEVWGSHWALIDSKRCMNGFVECFINSDFLNNARYFQKVFSLLYKFFLMFSNFLKVFQNVIVDSYNVLSIL